MAKKNEDACTDHLEPFDHRTTNPRDKRPSEWSNGGSISIGQAN